jgi:hypothetical protein
MQELTSKDIRGSLTRLNGEIESKAVHKYITPYDPALTEEEIELRYQGVEGVIDVNANDISDGYPQYRVEVHLRSTQAVFKENYQDILDQTS